MIKEAYRLNCMRGSKWAIERIAEIVLGEPVVILESNIMKAYVEETGQEQFNGKVSIKLSPCCSNRIWEIVLTPSPITLIIR